MTQKLLFLRTFVVAIIVIPWGCAADTYESIYEKQIKNGIYKSAIIVEGDILKWIRCRCHEPIHCHKVDTILLVGWVLFGIFMQWSNNDSKCSNTFQKGLWNTRESLLPRKDHLLKAKHENDLLTNFLFNRNITKIQLGTFQHRLWTQLWTVMCTFCVNIGGM